MHFTSLSIENFRAIASFNVSDLHRLVVVAGPNGCGKSSIFDAMRLLKSVYGGYSDNEYMQWFGEFQIDLSNRSRLQSVFRDPGRPVSIRANVVLAQSERLYLENNAEDIVELGVWSEITGQSGEAYDFSPIGFAAAYPSHVAAVRDRVEALALELRRSSALGSHDLHFELSPEGDLRAEPSAAVRASFRTFAPTHLGIIDFHGASRTYQREGVGGVSLDQRSIESQRRHHALYNWQAKYQNVKTELITAYLRELISREAGAESAAVTREAPDLNATLSELFETFFPHKRYKGVVPSVNGDLAFPVQLEGGGEHDLNELSSGEKEILYGYLRMRNKTPRHSTILIDEPELHLNPGLLRNMPAFYHKHIAEAHDNQLWLVTHSDALLRQSVGNPSYNVFHMTYAGGVGAELNQATSIVGDDLQTALMDLVGDAAAYRPYAKVLVFEGDAGKQFDVQMVSRLFPQVGERVNLVSGESKGRVKDLYAALSRTARQVGLAQRFYAITDRDFESQSLNLPDANVLTWDVYHIENYLLSPLHILRVLERISQPGQPLDTESKISDALKACAESTTNGLASRHLQSEINRALVGSIVIRGDRQADPIVALTPSVEASLQRLEVAKRDVTDAAWLEKTVGDYVQTLSSALDDGSWIENFPGRPILRAFLDRHVDGVKYEAFVNLIINEMVDVQYQPPGMVATLARILPVAR